MAKGIQGRSDATGVSEFKTWAAFEEKATLLWTNAYFYNEEDSEIYALAQELEVSYVRLHLPRGLLTILENVLQAFQGSSGGRPRALAGQD